MAGFSPRLHVLLAPRARVGLVLRRGPSHAVCAIGWDRERDTFKVGQWLRGRIYERRSDLSPDGRHAIYFAMNGRWKSRTKGSWTAISRAPYIAAVTLYAKGDCWHGGGLFVDDRTYWLNDGYGHKLLGDTSELRRADPAPYQPVWGGECWGVYFHRLLRDGWTIREDLAVRGNRASTVVFERSFGHGWTLRKRAHAMVGPPQGKGVYHDEHELVRGERVLRRERWEWADLDGDRLVWAEAGALWAGRISMRSATTDDPVEDPHVLHDFGDMTLEAIAAPYPRLEPRPRVAADPKRRR